MSLHGFSIDTRTPAECLPLDATCLEGALKIKEVSYMHSEGVRVPRIVERHSKY